MFRAVLSCLAMAAIGLVLSAVYWPRVPDPMPSHWNIHGQVDGYMPRSVGLMLAPALALLMGLVLSAIGRRGPAEAADDTGVGAVRVICLWMAGFFLALHMMTLHAALTPGHPLSGRLVVFMVGLLFVMLGVQMPRLKRNRWCGIRVRWTMESDTVWAATHAFAGPCYIWSGVAAMIGCLLPPVAMTAVLLTAILVGCTLAPILYAWRAWQAEQRA